MKTWRRGIERQGEVGRGRERERERERIEKNDNRSRKGDKLRNEECIHERGGG